MKKSVFLSAIKALYKKEEVDVADHLKTVDGDEVEDTLVETILKELDAQKVTTFKTEATERFNNGVKKGEKTKADFFEKKLKALFNVEDATLQGEDLISHIEENLPVAGDPAKEGKLDLSKLTEAELLKVPVYIQKMKDISKQLKEKDTEKDKAVEAVKNEQTEAGLKSEATTKALALLDAKNPILPKDASKATTMKNRLLADELKGHKWMKGTDGSLIPLDEEGKQLTDANGNAVDFDGLVDKIITANFEFNITDPRSTPGSKNKPNPQGDKKWTGKKPANQQEYTELLLDDTIETDQKTALMEEYSETFG